jgi:hypothetical protein
VLLFQISEILFFLFYRDVEEPMQFGFIPSIDHGVIYSSSLSLKFAEIEVCVSLLDFLFKLLRFASWNG